MRHYSIFRHRSFLWVLCLFGTLACSSDKDEEDQANPAPVILRGTISADRVLVNSASSVDYYLEEIVEVNAKLTIEPGTVILGKAGSGLRISGSGSGIVALGTASKPIVIRSESRLKGGWLGILFDNSNNPVNELAHTEISDGGSASFDGDASKKATLQLSGTNRLKMHHCTIANSASFGILENFSSDLSLGMFEANTFQGNENYPVYAFDRTVTQMGTGHTFSGNSENVIALKQKDFNGLQGNHLWKKQAAPYLWTDSDNLVVGYFSGDGFLTLEAGLTLIMAPGSALVVGDNANQNSTIQVLGTVAEPVSIRGETASKGAWKGILIKTPQDGNRIENATIRDGGSAPLAGGSRANVVVDRSARLQLTNVKLENSAGCGYSLSTTSSPAAIVVANGLSFSGNTSGTVCTF